MAVSDYQVSGTFTTDTSSDPVLCAGWVTISAVWNSGTGTVKVQKKWLDGTWRDVYAGDDNVTLQSYTANFSLNIFLGVDEEVRLNASSTSSADIDYELIGTPLNRA